MPRSGGPGGGGAGRNVRRLTIYVLKGGQAEPVEVQLGITDGSKTEVTGGEINENDSVIIGMTGGAQTSSGVANPFQPRRPGGFARVVAPSAAAAGEHGVRRPRAGHGGR